MSLLEDWATPDLAERWDNVGLQVGNPTQPVSRVLIALTVTSGVLEEAAARGCDMVLGHHPVIFPSLSTLRSDRPENAPVLRALALGLAVGIAHTNLDRAEGGLNDWLADELGLADRTVVEKGSFEGLARLGRLAAPVALGDWVAHVSRQLQVPALRYVGDPRRPISQVMTMAGSGGGAVSMAIQCGADVLVTGDLKFHQALEAREAGLSVVDAGHYATEAIVRRRLAEYMQKAVDRRGWEVKFLTSETESDPFRFYRV